MSRRLLVALLALLVAAPAARAAEADAERAERCWRDRGRSFAERGAIDREATRCAVEGWREAARSAPARLDWAQRRIEALWFAAHFGAGDRGERDAWLDEAVAAADAAVAEVDRRAGVAGRHLELAARARALASVPEAGDVHFFAAIAWGEWGTARGWIAAATRGVAGRLREHAELAAALAPDLRCGGGLRLLGRVHATMPRLPLVTGWVDRRRGLELLRAALASSRDEPRNLLFLAEAILDQQPARREEALALLGELARRAPDPDEVVEQSETLARARELLADESAEERG